MSKKPGYTLEQHEKLGLELQIMRDRLNQVAGELSEAYPVKISNIAIRARDGVDDLRKTLDKQIFIEYRGQEGVGSTYRRSGKRLSTDGS